ncbi:MAG TPA: fluoride efflux transporter CrcB [Bacteroidetes bacterium]|nr:fluoride efflux transporter CrcB [Bacteroidota bacterium]HRK05514.1 fluoride efflux transporter CrcB [Chlorobiota bacterium]
MRAFDLVVVMIGGGLGSALRYGVSLILTSPNAGTFPVSTLLVNIVGSGVLGLVLGLSSKLSSSSILLVGTGLCGGFTTFSTFSGETLTLLSEGRYGTALAYIGVSVVGGLTCAALTYGLARRFAAA